MIIPNLRDLFWSDMVIAVQQTVRSDGYHVLLTHSEDSGEREREEIETLVSRCVDALLVASCADDCNALTLERVEKSGVPVLLFDRYADDLSPGVFTDDVGGARMAVQHLLLLGRRRIAHLAGDLRLSPARDRLRGYRAAMEDAGLSPIVIEAGFGEKNGYRAMQQLLERRDADSVFAVHDHSAIGALEAALERGVRVPEDMAIVGFSNTDCARHVTVPLTTISQAKQKLGETLASLAMQRIADKTVAQPRIVLPTQIVVRRSCGASEGVTSDHKKEGEEL